MKLAFINLPRRIPHGYNLGLLYLISTIEKMHQVELIDLNWISNKQSETDYVLKRIDESKPDIIGFSVISSTYHQALRIAKEIKKRFPYIRLIYGGIHPTVLPEETIKHPLVDAICIGEGEYSFLEIITSSACNSVSNF